MRLLATAPANSALRASDRAPQLQLAQTNFTKTCYHFCHSTVGRRICWRIASRKWVLAYNCTWEWCFLFPGTKTGAILYLSLAILRLRYNMPDNCSVFRLKLTFGSSFCTPSVHFTAFRYNLIIPYCFAALRRFYQYCDKTIARLPKILFMLAAAAELCLRLAEQS